MAKECPIYPNCSESCSHIDYDVDGGYYCFLLKKWIIPQFTT